MPHTVRIRHNFEAAHRIPVLAGKCENLHGHSWWADITVTAAELDENGTVVEFGSYKRAVRNWIDERLDHGVILGQADPLLPILAAHGKTYMIPTWPTVERIAALLGHVCGLLLDGQVRAPGAYVSRVHLAETHVNAATWEASCPSAAAHA
jgi:6-pyruvoyltetrahydropterin/6-carboxytetrahydropterin synthase